MRLRDSLGGLGVPGHAIDAVAAVPPVELMFAAFLPSLLSGPFHDGLVVVFVLAAALAIVAAVVSLLRGGVYIHEEEVPAESVLGQAEKQ